MMSRSREEIEVLPPKFNDDSNPLVVEEGSKSGTSKTPALEDLMKKLEKLKAENKKLKVKGKKYKTYSSSNEDGDSSFKEEVSHKERKGRNKHDMPSYNSMSFNHNNMPNSTAYTSVPVGKASRFDGSNYNQ
jgi:predicted RNase H-like nuclease (RuvC/YqgF family)